MESQELIGKVKLNYKWYKGTDLYSDGDDVENHILDIVSNESGFDSHPCCNSRSSPTYPSPLEMKHEGPAHIQGSPVSASELEMRDPFPVS